MKIVITGDYAILSRGKISAKHKESGEWASNSGGKVILDRPGEWMISQNDGFKRKETIYVTVTEDGEVEGLTRRFDIVE